MFSLRLIQQQDNATLARIIRQVSAKFGLAPESGFAVADSALDDLYAVYHKPHAAYWVIENQHHEVFGGGGLSPLQGDPTRLEIQKMYFLPEIRRQGFAEQILQNCFEFARSQGYLACYLETTENLIQAIKLYEKLGFQYLDHPKGNTGHSHACEIWMEKSIL